MFQLTVTTTTNAVYTLTFSDLADAREEMTRQLMLGYRCIITRL